MTETDKADRRYSSRKFLLAAFVLLAACVGRALGLLTPELTVDLVKWTLGMYFAGNVGAAAVPVLQQIFAPKAAT